MLVCLQSEWQVAAKNNNHARERRAILATSEFQSPSHKSSLNPFARLMLFIVPEVFVPPARIGARRHERDRRAAPSRLSRRFRDKLAAPRIRRIQPARKTARMPRKTASMPLPVHHERIT